MIAVEHSNEYIRELESKVEGLENEVRNLKSKLILLQGKKHSKKELREMYEWNEQDVLFSDTVMTFCKEFLFPRYKFLGKNWTEKNDTSPTSFSELIRRNLPTPRGMNFGDAWNRIIAPTIAKKYTDLRCNINNECRSAFLGKSSRIGFGYMNYYAMPCDIELFIATQSKRMQTESRSILTNMPRASNLLLKRKSWTVSASSLQNMSASYTQITT